MYVRVIIPVHNDAEGLKECLSALKAQTHPITITVVDDGSDPPITSVEETTGLQVIVQENQGSYAARNRGIRSSEESILAFCDADCIPGSRWVEHALQLLDSGADLVGGHVEFKFRDHPSGAERFDAITNLQIEKGIQTKRIAKTANLITRREVFDAIGLFPDNVRSGGDVTWSHRATEAGFHLVYSPNAVVFHPARRLRQLMSKQVRVGRGHMTLDEPLAPPRFLSGLRPTSWAMIRDEHSQRGWPASHVAVTRTWLAGIVAKMATGLGRLLSFLDPNTP